MLKVNEELIKQLHAVPTLPPVDIPEVFPSGARQPWYESKVTIFLTKLRDQNVGRAET